MSHLAANLDVFYRGHPEFEGRRLELVDRAEGVRILPAASGVPTAQVGSVYLHSRYDPVREAERVVEVENLGETTAAVFYGFGLGYLVEAFRRRCPGLPAVIIEPDTTAFAAALGARDLREVLGAGEFFWHVGDEPEAAMMSLDGLPLGRLEVFRLRPLESLHAAYFRRVDVAVRALLDRREVNLNTLKRFGRLWLRNLLSNLEEFAACPGVGRLEGRFDGIPALVLAAGPSLDALLPNLPELRRRLLLVAVDTSYRRCCEAGVEPDLLVTVDPQYWNTRHLDRGRFDGTVVISESSAHPRLFRRGPGAAPALYFVSSFFPLGALIEESVGKKGKVGAGGSVATTAWDLARLLGCRPLFMGGLDLGYPGGRTHCRGAFFEELMHCHSARLLPAECTHFRALHEAGPFALANNSGGETLTDRRLVVYKWWFENQLAQLKPGADTRTGTLSLSPEGLAIEGMPLASMSDLLELPPVRSFIDRALKAARREAREYQRHGGEERVRAALSVLDGLCNDLERLRSRSARARAVCADLQALEGSSGSEGRAQLLGKLDVLDGEILELAARNVAGFLFQGLIQRILDSGGRERTLSAILDVSEELYRELERSAEYHLVLIRGAVAKVGFR